MSKTTEHIVNQMEEARDMLDNVPVPTLGRLVSDGDDVYVSCPEIMRPRWTAQYYCKLNGKPCVMYQGDSLNGRICEYREEE